MAKVCTKYVVCLMTLSQLLLFKSQNYCTVDTPYRNTSETENYIPI